MKVLLVKTSSMGDVVHTLTAVHEAKARRPDLRIDWLVEADFADIARLAQQNGDIEQVIPIRFRRWRQKKPFSVFFHPVIKQLKQQLRSHQYDRVLDAQGLLKSVFLARLAGAPITGFDRNSAREGLAARFYQQSLAIGKNQHAIARLRQLFSQTFAYTLPPQPPVIHRHNKLIDNQILFFHGTTWDNKAYPTTQWRGLAQQLTASGYQVVIPQHGEAEKQVATTIAAGLNAAIVLPEQRLSELIDQLKTARAVVSVDTGLAHLAVYLGVPTVMLFGPTRADLTGGIGAHTINLVGQAADTGSMKRQYYGDNNTFSPSMQAISVAEIITALQSIAE